MDMLNPDIGSDGIKKSDTPADATSKLPPPPTYPPPPPPLTPPAPPPPPCYPAPQPPQEPSPAEFLKVKSNLRHVKGNTNKKEVRWWMSPKDFSLFIPWASSFRGKRLTKFTSSTLGIVTHHTKDLWYKDKQIDVIHSLSDMGWYMAHGCILYTVGLGKLYYMHTVY